MNEFTRDFVLAACSAEARGADFCAQHVVKDSREQVAGSLYFALMGERFDGHNFVLDALANGAVAAVIDHKHAAVFAKDLPLLVVEDTQQALLDLARAHTQRCAATRLALTGSNGKTTTKEMIASICRHAYGADAVCATQGNLNNLIGLPLTVLSMSAATEVAVLEMGMNHLGEITRMAKAARPTIGLVLNIHSAHLEGLGSIEKVAEAKGELYAAIDDDGVVCVNIDDDRCVAQAKRSQARQVLFGSSDDADVKIEASEPTSSGQRLSLRIAGSRVDIKLKHLGQHNARNAAAAAAVAVALGCDVNTIVAGLEDAPVVKGRLAVRDFGGITLVDDSYNANIASMRAAIDVARVRAADGRFFAALGEMRELGAHAERLHNELGVYVAQHHPDLVWFCGKYAVDAKRGAIDAGLAVEKIRTALDCNEIVNDVCARVHKGDVLLVKGSRGARMERVVDAVQAATTQGSAER